MSTPTRGWKARLDLFVFAFNTIAFGLLLLLAVIGAFVARDSWGVSLLLIAFFLGMEVLSIFQLRRARRGLAARAVK